MLAYMSYAICKQYRPKTAYTFAQSNLKRIVAFSGLFMIFSNFSKNIRYDSSCKLFPIDTICPKHQT